MAGLSWSQQGPSWLATGPHSAGSTGAEGCPHPGEKGLSALTFVGTWRTTPSSSGAGQSRTQPAQKPLPSTELAGGGVERAGKTCSSSERGRGGPARFASHL